MEAPSDTPRSRIDAFPSCQDEATKAITAGIEEGYVVPIVGKTLPLDAAAAAHELLVPAPGQPSSGTVGNVVLLP